VDELRFANALASRTVKQNGVSVGLPDRSQLDASRAVQAKEDAARFSAANQNSLCHLKGTNLELILLANCIVDIGFKVIQIVNLERVSRHWQHKLLNR
jgi:hypothetical protein